VEWAWLIHHPKKPKAGNIWIILSTAYEQRAEHPLNAAVRV